MLYRLNLMKTIIGKHDTAMLVNLTTVQRIRLNKKRIEIYYPRPWFQATPQETIRYNTHEQAIAEFQKIQDSLEQKKEKSEIVRWDMASPDLWAVEEVSSYEPEKQLK